MLPALVRFVSTTDRAEFVAQRMVGRRADLRRCGQEVHVSAMDCELSPPDRASPFVLRQWQIGSRTRIFFAGRGTGFPCHDQGRSAGPAVGRRLPPAIRPAPSRGACGDRGSSLFPGSELGDGQVRLAGGERRQAASTKARAHAAPSSVGRVPASTGNSSAIRASSGPSPSGCRDELRSKLIVYLVDGDDLIILQSRYHY